MSVKILVLGATGQVGAGVVEGLQGIAGVEVVAGARASSHHKLPEGVARVSLDYGDPGTFDEALRGVDRLFLMSPPGVVDAVGLLGPFLERALGVVERVVMMTAAGIEASDAIPLRQVELMIERSGVAYAHLRPGWFMQNFHTFWKPGLDATGSILVPAESSRTAFIDARDISAAAVGALTRTNHVNAAYTLTGPESLTYGEAAARLSEVTGREIGYVSIDEERFAEGLRGAGLPEDYVGMMLGMMAAVRAGFAAPISHDVEALTGRAPRTLLDYARDYRAALAAV